MFRYDKLKLTEKPKKTKQGYLRVRAGISRADCVLTYKRADGSLVREFRPKEEIFNSDSVETARSLPIIPDTHVSKVDVNNTSMSIGHSSDVVIERGDLLETDLLFTHKDYIPKIEKGKYSDISPGYELESVDETPGEYNGQRYDRIQRGVSYNHLALLPAGKGRQGSQVGLRLDSDDAIFVDNEKHEMNGEDKMKVKLRFDGKDVEIEVSNEAEVQILKDFSERYDAKNKELEQTKGELDSTKKNLASEKTRADSAESTEVLNKVVNERIDAISTLKRFDSNVDIKTLEEKSVKEIRIACLVSAGHKREDYNDVSDDFVFGAYKGMSTLVDKPQPKAVGGFVPSVRQDKKETELSARQEMNQRLSAAWEGSN